MHDHLSIILLGLLLGGLFVTFLWYGLLQELPCPEGQKMTTKFVPVPCVMFRDSSGTLHDTEDKAKNASKHCEVMEVLKGDRACNVWSTAIVIMTYWDEIKKVMES